MTYNGIYKRLEEFCNTCSMVDYAELDPNETEVYNICEDLKNFLEQNYVDLYYEVYHDIEYILLECPHEFVEEYPTEKDLILYLLEDVDTWTIAEWISLDLDRNRIIKEYLFKNNL